MSETEYLVERPLKRPPIHPGEILRNDVLPALKMTVIDAASQLGVSRQTLHAILNGRSAITPEMALRIGKFCGNGPDLWLSMQAAYDLWHAGQRLKDDIEKIPTHKAA